MSYEALTSDEKQTLGTLFERATGGVRLLIPAVDSPLNWICEFAAAVTPHMRRISELENAASFHKNNPSCKEALKNYDPRQQS